MGVPQVSPGAGSLNTAHRRADAHAFYEALGYEHTGRRYAKKLA